MTPSIANSFWQSHNISMPCPDAMKLREEYEVALGNWGKANLIEDEATDQVRLAVFQVRNEAAGRLLAHQAGCATCRREQLTLIRGQFGKDHLRQQSPD
jgi:hypothetical protein